MTVTGTNVQPAATFPGAESPGTTVTLTPGAYSVDEAADRRLHQDPRRRLLRHRSPTARPRPAPITNDDKPGTLTVIKHVINDNGGTKTAARLHDDRDRHQRPAERDLRRCRVAGHDGDVECRHLQRRRSGRRRATPRSIGANCSGTIANGETKTCTITNDDKPAHADRDQARHQRQRWHEVRVRLEQI